MIRKENKRRRVPELNTTATADISFMLLTFFLVTTSMDTDRGLTTFLQAPDDSSRPADAPVERRNVLEVGIGTAGQITCNGAEVSRQGLVERVEEFVENPANSAELPEKSLTDIPLLGRVAVTSKHIISLDVDPNADYNTYFEVQNAIAVAYGNLRNRLAKEHFGRPYSKCSEQQRKAVASVFTPRISESADINAKGGRP